MKMQNTSQHAFYILRKSAGTIITTLFFTYGAFPVLAGPICNGFDCTALRVGAFTVLFPLVIIGVILLLTWVFRHRLPVKKRKYDRWILIAGVSLIILNMGYLKFVDYLHYKWVLKNTNHGIAIAGFKKLANDTKCADQKNSFYAIDGTFVFWIREGNCPDNSYSYTLFGSNATEALCTISDSIAGPRRSCADKNSEQMFETIIDNVNRNDLGLGDSHKVWKIL